MSKRTLLLIDGDARSLRVLEVSLRKSGFAVTTAETVADAVEKLSARLPDLIISETKFEDGNGFDLRRRISERDDWREIPFVFLTAESAIEYKIKGLELGVDDYLTKPIYVKEIVARINILLQKKERSRIEERKDLRTRFVGRIADMPVVDVIQTIEISRKSGVITFVGERQQQAAIYFRDGKVIDAEAGTLLAEDAVYRLLTWIDGDFEVAFRMIRRREVIATSSQALLMEGMRRLDEWTLLLEQLPSYASKFEVDTDELALRLGGLPDAYNRVLRLIDGKRSLLELVESCDLGDLECLQVIVRLYFEGLLLDVSTPEEQQAVTRAKTGRMRASSESPIRTRSPSQSGPISLPTNEVATADATAATPDPAAENVYEPSPLLGGYRNSSLRLIDAAVAAAEAVDGAGPDGVTPWWKAVGLEKLPESDAAHLGRIALVKGGRQRADLTSDALDQAINAAEPTDDSDLHRSEQAVTTAAVDAEPTLHKIEASIKVLAADIVDESEVAPTRTENELTGNDAVPSVSSDEIKSEPTQFEQSGEIRRLAGAAPRMISSRGKETAQVAGEVSGTSHGKTVEGPARQMVTILPRRSTREIQVVSLPSTVERPAESDAGPAEHESATYGVAVVAMHDLETVTITSAEPAETAAPVARARTPRPSVQIPLTGGTTRKSQSQKGLMAAISAAVVAAVAIIYATCRSNAPNAPASGLPNTTTVTAPIDPQPPVTVQNGDTQDAALPASQDAVSGAGTAIGLEPGLQNPRVPSTAAPPTQKIYKEALEKANEALREGDAATALRRVNESITDRPTARGYVVKADALRRLGKNDEAVLAADNATRMAADFAPAWEMKGRVLWGAKRTTEATLAFKRFLALEPKSKRADDVRALIGE